MSSPSSSNISKTTSTTTTTTIFGHDNPPFYEKKLSMRKSKAMMVLQTMDYSMLNILKDGPHVPMFLAMKENVKDGEEIKKPAYEFGMK